MNGISAKRISTRIAAVGCAFALCLAIETPAQATATGIATFSEVCPEVDPLPTPVCGDTQQFTATVVGSGLRITEGIAFFSPMTAYGATQGAPCDWRIDFTVRDSSGKLQTAVMKGSVNRGCAKGGIGKRKLVRNINVSKPGTWCATLYGRYKTDGNTAKVRALVEVCHSLKP